MCERQVRIVLILTFSTPVATICAALFGVTRWFAAKITSPVDGSMMSSARYLPVIRSSNDSRISAFASLLAVALSFTNSDTYIPGIVLPALQSVSLIIKSCDTSTRRLVRYPESAVRSAVSDRPLRAPCAEMKYSSTSRPSRKLDLIGSSIVLPDVSAIKPRIPASCLICWLEPRAPESAIMKMLLYLSRPSIRASFNASSVSCHTRITFLCLSSSVERPLL